ncbi:MAG: ATP-binding protein [Caldilineaceae bacterium]|nr:ATP-binding protein [Caldilineaceae bacterium]
MHGLTFGDCLLEYLGRSDFSQAWLARKMGIHRTTVNKWIAGENQIPSHQLAQCCSLLNLTALESSEIFILAGYRELGFSHLITWVLAGNSPTIHDLTACCERLQLTTSERTKLWTIVGISETVNPPSTALPVAPQLAPQKSYNAILYTTPDNLRKPSALLGRQEILAAITPRLEAGQHILLAGYSGVGKTAIAATLADQQIRTGKGPVLWLEAKDDDLDSLLEGLAAPLGEQNTLAPLSDDAKIHKMKEVLTTHQIGLVVLDNFQQAHLFRSVRQAIPAQIPMLVTSWQNFINIDYSITIPALAPSAALTLVAQHAANSDYDDQSYQQDTEMPELCRQLHYHPLLLMIAGSQLRSFRRKASYLLARLDSVLALEGPPDLAEAKRPTMQMALEQMIEVFMQQKQAITDDRRGRQQRVQTVRLLLRTLGAFPEPSATAAFLVAVVDKPMREVEDALDEMTRWNLLTRNQESFYTMHDMIHHYARGLYDKATRPNRHQLVAAIAQYTQDQAKVFAELRLNLPNILYAATQASDEQCLTIIAALALQGYQDNRGHQLAYLKLLERVLLFLERHASPVTTAEETKQRHHLLCKRGNAHFDRGEYEQAVAIYQQALDCAYNDDRKIRTLSLLGKSLAFADSRVPAESFFAQAYKFARELDNDILLSFVLQQEAHAAGFKEDYTKARQVAIEQVSICERLLAENPTEEIKRHLFRSLVNVGTAELKLGKIELTRILEYHHRAEQLAMQLNHEELIAHANWALAEDYHAMGQRSMAQRYLIEAVAIYSTQGLHRDLKSVTEFIQQNNYA